MGTFGAFIRIRSAILTKRVLFDIGAAGPLAGFVFLLPALAIGMAFSKIIPGIAYQGDIQFGTPGLQWILEKLIFPGVPAGDIYLHPVARAAWIGILATALNLLPIGQLDGGHILYSLVGERHKMLSKVFIAALIPLGFRWWLFTRVWGIPVSVWWLWAIVLFFLARRHPVIVDPASLSPGRKWLALASLIIFVLCFTAEPVTAIGPEAPMKITATIITLNEERISPAPSRACAAATKSWCWTADRRTAPLNWRRNWARG